MITTTAIGSNPERENSRGKVHNVVTDNVCPLPHVYHGQTIQLTGNAVKDFQSAMHREVAKLV